MSRRAPIPALIALSTAGAAAACWLTPSASPERVIAALALLLAFPGAALSHLLHRSGRGLGGGAVLLIPALSIAIVILDSALLYVIGIRLDLHSWIISVGAVTVAIALLGPLRSRPLAIRAGVGLGRRRRIALVAGNVLAGGLIAAATLVTVSSVRSRLHRERFVQLWALAPELPDRAATVGVYNHQGARRTYFVDVYVNGRVSQARSVSLENGGTWTIHTRFPARARNVRVTLFGSGADGTVFHSVHLRFGA